MITIAPAPSSLHGHVPGGVYDRYIARSRARLSSTAPTHRRMSALAMCIDHEPVTMGYTVLLLDDLEARRGWIQPQVRGDLLRLQNLDCLSHAIIGAGWPYGTVAVVWEPRRSMVISLPTLARACEVASGGRVTAGGGE